MDKQMVVVTTCEVCGITPDQLRERTKRKQVAYARQIIAFILWDRNICGLREIAQIVGVARNSIYYPLRPRPRKRDMIDGDLRDWLHETQKRIG